MMRPVNAALLAAMCTLVAVGCAKNKTTEQSMQGESSTDSLALLDSPRTARPGVRTASVISADDAPASAEIVSCVEQSLGASGYDVIGGLDTDVIVICRAHPRNEIARSGSAQAAVAGTPFYDRSTSIVAEDTLVRIPPSWIPSRPPSRWLATVEMHYTTTTDDRGAGSEALSRIDVLIGTEGIGPAFTRDDLNELWAALEKCAATRVK